MFISRSWNTWWCVRGWCEGGEQCSVTASWWCCLGAYTFIGCKLHCCILSLLTHHHDLTCFSLMHFTSINISDWIKQHDHSCNMRDVYNPHIFMQAFKLLLKAKKYCWRIYCILHSLHYLPHLSLKLYIMSTFAHACPHNAMHSLSF